MAFFPALGASSTCGTVPGGFDGELLGYQGRLRTLPSVPAIPKVYNQTRDGDGLQLGHTLGQSSLVAGGKLLWPSSNEWGL